MEILKTAHLTGHQASVFVLTHSKKNNFFLSGAGDGWIVEWDINNSDIGQLLAKVESNIFSLLHLAHLQIIIAGNMNGGIHFIDIENTDNNKNIAHHQKGVYDIQYFSNHIYTIGGDGIITKWQISPFKSLESFQISSKSLRCMAYSEVRDEIAIGASDGNIYLLDTQFNIKNILKQAHKNSIFSIKYTPNSSHLLSGGRDAILKIWDLDNYKSIIELPAHNFTINNIQLNPYNPLSADKAGSVFATASRDKTIKIWHLDFEKENKVKLLKVINTIKNGGHINSVNSLLWLNESQLASAGDDRSIILWKIIFENSDFI